MLRHPVLGIRVEPLGDVAVETVALLSCRAPLSDVGARASVSVERRTHLLQAAVQAGLGRTQGNPERGGDLRQRQVEVVMQDNDRPLLGLEPAEAAFELVAVGDPRHGIRAGWRVGQVGDVDIQSTSFEASDLVDAGARHQAVQPGIEPVGVAQRGQITPGVDEGVSWTASVARSGSRRMSRAAASSRKIAAPASAAKAS